MQPGVISLVRYGLLGALLLCSLINLGLSGHLVGVVAGFAVPDYLGLALAISVITMVIVVPAVVIDFFRKGAFTSMVAVELGWSFVLMILWIASAGASTAAQAGVNCNFVVNPFAGESFGSANEVCHEAQAIIAFGWLGFFLLLAWVVLLMFLTITSHTRGNTGVWTQPVTGTDFFAQKEGMGQLQSQYGGVPQNAYGAPPMQQQYTGSPMQQQHTGAPVQTQYSGSPGPQYTPTPPPQPQQATYPPSGYPAQV
ncbi:hypothetical protein BU17DRAFT_78819 [Hysterangium stoloniferum]|nr:hypothetical protein BU17DRAFT_78819 [Hysterangium stoloniferum]